MLAVRQLEDVVEIPDEIAEQLINYLNDHADDIMCGENDFGDLRGALEFFSSKEPALAWNEFILDDR